MNDEEWHRNVEDHLLRDLIEDLQEKVKDHDVILNGERGKTGIIAEYDRHDEKLTRLYAVVFQDPTGQKGLLHDVDYLMGRKSRREESRQYRWQAWGLIAATIISSVTTLILGWDKIQKILPKYHPGPLEQKIDQARHPKSTRKIYRYRVIHQDLDLGEKIVPPTPENKPKESE